VLYCYHQRHHPPPRPRARGGGGGGPAAPAGGGGVRRSHLTRDVVKAGSEVTPCEAERRSRKSCIVNIPDDTRVQDVVVGSHQPLRFWRSECENIISLTKNSGVIGIAKSACHGSAGWSLPQNKKLIIGRQSPLPNPP
jgi:hypothetical protein